jgi:amino acid adenylation domain-containing protein
MFNLDRALRRELAGFGALDVRGRSIPRVAEYFELFLNLVEEPDGITVECQYNADLFDRATVTAWLESYLELLRSAARDPRARVADLEWIPAEARALLRGAWQGPALTLPTESVVRLVRTTAAARPGAVALRWAGGTVSYAELIARVDAVASALRARGVADGDLVALAVPRSPELPVALLGILAAGAAYVPIDLDHPAARLRMVMEDAAPVLILGTAEQTALAAERLGGDVPPTVALDELLRAGAGTAPPALPERGDRTAYVIYTSGSTGVPKGVRIPHRAVVNALVSFAERLGVGPDDAIPALTTPTFDISVLELLLPLAVGGATVFVDEPARPDPRSLAGELERLGATVMQATPSAFALLLEGGWPGSPGLRLLAGGETLPAHLAERLLEKSAGLWNMYGPTETTIWSACHRVARGDDPVPLGRPIGNTRIQVLDREGHPVPPGVPGEIAIAGAGVAEGYHRRAELTAARFSAATPDVPERCYRTGDVGRWRPDGVLLFHGRNDDQIKLRGHRIELAEVEGAFASHPAVRAAAAALRPGAGGEPVLAVFLVAGDAASGGPPTDEQLRAHARGRVPEYMVPQRFVWIERIPRSAAGKVDRRALPGLPDLERSHAADQLPGTDEAQAAALIWEELLGVPVTSGAHDFFELGGHSVLAMRVIARVNARFGTALGLGVMFEASRLDAFAGRIAAARADLAGEWEEIVV